MWGPFPILGKTSSTANNTNPRARKKTNPYERFPRKTSGDADTAGDGPRSPGVPGPARPSGWFPRRPARPRSPLKPGANITHRESRARPGVEKGDCAQRKDREEELGEKGAKAVTDQAPPSPNFHSSRGTTPVKAHLAHRHFRQPSRNPGGLRALWSAPSSACASHGSTAQSGRSELALEGRRAG